MPDDYSKKCMFSQLSPWKPHKGVLKPQNKADFSHNNQFEGSHAYVYFKKMNVFLSFSLET